MQGSEISQDFKLELPEVLIFHAVFVGVHSQKHKPGPNLGIIHKVIKAVPLYWEAVGLPVFIESGIKTMKL